MAKQVVLISSFFEPKYSYQETQIADALHRMGYSVTVVTSHRQRENGTIEEEEIPYKVIRLRSTLKISSTIFYVNYRTGFIEEIEPDYVILVEPYSGLPFHLLGEIPDSAKVISFYSVIYNHINKNIKSKISRNIIKSRWTREAIQQSDVVVANTNQTASILSKRVTRVKERRKIIMPGLGFDKTKFYYDPQIREKTRKRLNVYRKRMVITVTRIAKYKNIFSNIEPVLKSLRARNNLVYMLVGFDGSQYSNHLKQRLLSLDVSGQLLLKEFADDEEINEYLNAADGGYWYRPSIAIQQALGTGLYVFLPDYKYDNTLDHLLENNKSGYYYSSTNDLEEQLCTLDFDSDRKKMAKYNHKFSYVNILKKVISFTSTIQ